MRKSENDGEEFRVVHSRIAKNTEAKAREKKKIIKLFQIAMPYHSLS